MGVPSHQSLCLPSLCRTGMLPDPTGSRRGDESSASFSPVDKLGFSWCRIAQTEPCVSTTLRNRNRPGFGAASRGKEREEREEKGCALHSTAHPSLWDKSTDSSALAENQNGLGGKGLRVQLIPPSKRPGCSKPNPNFQGWGSQFLWPEPYPPSSAAAPCRYLFSPD